MKRLSTAVGILILLAMLLTAGCYTVLRHPTGRDIVQEGEYYRTCSDCHADAAYYHPYYRYGWSQYRWRGYYGYPWWYDDYSWWDPHDGYDGDEGPEVERGTRHLWGSSGWASGGWGFHTPTVGESPPTQDVEPTEKPKEKEDDRKSQDEEKKKDATDSWKNRKKGF